MPSSNQIHLLQTRRFLPLFLVQFLGAFNDNVFKNAFVILLTYRLAAPLGWDPEIGVTVISGLFIFPFFLFSAFAGQLADKYEKAKLSQWIKVWEIIAMALAWAGFHWQNVWFLFFVLFMMGAHSTFFGPIKYGILPSYLQKDELVGGNALIEAATYIAILAGTMLGGWFILKSYGLWLVGLLVVGIAIAGWIASLYLPRTESQQPSLKLNPNLFSETWNLLAYTRQHPEVQRCINGISWFWVIGATWLTLIPAYVQKYLHQDEKVVTGLLVLFAIGIGTGSMLCNHLLKGETSARHTPLAALILSVFTFDFVWVTWSLAPGPLDLQSFEAARLAVDLVGLAICGGIFSVPLYALMQHRSEPSHRARVIASNNVMNAFFMVLAAGLTGALLAMKWTIPQVILLVAILNLFVAYYVRKMVQQYGGH
jgi:acyl-[acyl-carrier-protein]-phospholipid O-acyltransferase/long-chain-fatty-acid--[acyl-carrier-protein] ligase